MFKAIVLKSNYSFKGTKDDLNHRFSQLVDKFHNYKSFINTEASLIWKISGCITYFAELDSDFLGDSNQDYIPHMKADHFANNFYRLNNSLKNLSEIWGIEFQEPDENFKLLEDIRTLIVHSGEPVSNIKTLPLESYKDIQLGMITKSTKFNSILFSSKVRNYDYFIEIWSDKHDKQLSRKRLSEVDYNERKENQCDLKIYLNVEDVRNLVLCYIEEFILRAEGTKKERQVKKLPDIKSKVFTSSKEEPKINFDKIADLVSRIDRGGYIIEDDTHYWDGYGLKKFLDYVRQANPFNPISQEVKQLVEKRIFKSMTQYWDDIQSDKKIDCKIQSLDIRKIFSDCTPNFEKKAYLEGEKLFIHIVPYFNTPKCLNVTDFYYMLNFVSTASRALGKNLYIEQSNEGIVCDYFVKSIQMRIDNGLQL